MKNVAILVPVPAVQMQFVLLSITGPCADARNTTREIHSQGVVLIQYCRLPLKPQCHAIHLRAELMPYVKSAQAQGRVRVCLNITVILTSSVGQNVF